MDSSTSNTLYPSLPDWKNARPEEIACVDLTTGEKWTYGSLEASVQRMTGVFRLHGQAMTKNQSQSSGRFSIKAGDRVAVVARNSVHHLVLFLALTRIGAIFVPLSWRLPPRELRALLDDCTPVVLFTDDLLAIGQILPSRCHGVDLADLTAAIESTSSSPCVWKKAGCEVRESEKGPETKTDIDQDAVCLLLYTSGSTGVPKAVQHTAQSLRATVVNFATSASVSSVKTPVFLVDLPMYHVIGGVICTLVPLALGGTIVISDKFDASKTSSRLADSGLGITHYFCVPTMADALRAAPNFRPREWKTLQQLLTGGSLNPASNVRWWLDRGVRMVDGYGMTETGTICTMPTSHDYIKDVLRMKAGSVGLRGPLTRIRLVDSQDHEVAPGTPGELLVAGDHVSPGYWTSMSKPDCPAPKSAMSTLEDGSQWFRTGDVALCDTDGFIYIVDRTKDVYISGGENVYPAEVERALQDHPHVQDVAVVGVPDEVWGEAGYAFVVSAGGEDVHQDDIAEHCRERLARYKVPRRYVFVDRLPRNGSGKVLKHRLRDRIVGEDCLRVSADARGERDPSVKWAGHESFCSILS